MKFRFDYPSGDEIYVSPGQLYQIKSGKSGGGTKSYGFLTEENRRKEKRLRIPELNSGFDTVYWYGGETITEIAVCENGCFGVMTEETARESGGRLPLTFAVDVEKEGNYKVRAVITARREAEEVLLFQGRRRLAWKGSLASGERITIDFPVNICPIIPRGNREPAEDLTLDVTLIGEGVCLTELSFVPWEGRTVYIEGDSTVTDQSAEYPYFPGHSYAGWGQMLPACLGMKAAVSNHAHSGLTTESFRSEGHYALLLQRIKKGDICLFQFGHNDQKLKSLTAGEGYRKRLIHYIEEIREREGIPVLVTPLSRNSWRGNEEVYNDLLSEYASVCMGLAEEYQVPLLDLHKKSMDLIKRLGREKAKAFFFPSDYTHTNDYGAFLAAGCIFREMEKAGLVKREMAEAGLTEAKAAGSSEGTEKYAKNGMPGVWNPPEKPPVLKRPEKYAGIKNPEETELFTELERPEELLTRSEAMELVIAAMRFFPTNVYNDMFTEVIGHETYAGAVECAWQHGLIPEKMIENGKILPRKIITGHEFLKILRNGYRSRKQLTKQDKSLEESVEKAGVTVEGICRKEALTRKTAGDICGELAKRI